MNQPLDSAQTAVPAADVASVPVEPLAPHELERAVMNRLQSHPSLKFTRLLVHQCGQESVCIEGFLESNDQDLDLCEIVRGIHGIKSVVNRVMPAQPQIPKKG
jgi:hypothetical protein